MGDITHANRFAKSDGLGYCADMKYLAAFFGAVLLAFAPLQLRAQATPDDQYVSIYSQIQQADALQAAGQTRQALSTYSQAQQQLDKFQKMYPDWNPRIVNFRMNYLSEKITDLTGTVATNTPPPAAAGPQAGATPGAGGTAPAPAADVAALQTQIQNLQTENANLQAKLKEALAAQPAAASSQELAMAQAQVKSLMKENDLLRASAQPSNAAPKTASKDVKELQMTLAETKQKLMEETQRADKLALENQSLQARLQPMAKNPDALKALREENAMLKKQVATLQAQSESGGGNQGTELARLRAQVAELQSEADVNWLEKMALENRLAKSPPAESAAQTSMENQMPAENTGSNAAASFEAAVTATAAETNSAMETPGNSTETSASVAQAVSEIEANNFTAADQQLQAILSKNPDDASALSAYGYSKFKQQDYDAAFDALTHAAKLDPQNAQIQNYLGVTLSHKGRQAEAEEALLKAVQLEPGYAAAHNNLAVIYINAKPPKAELARWHYQKALDAGQPRNEDLERLLASKGAPVAAQ